MRYRSQDDLVHELRFSIGLEAIEGHTPHLARLVHTACFQPLYDGTIQRHETLGHLPALDERTLVTCLHCLAQ